jgi:N utilization substance protein B
VNDINGNGERNRTNVARSRGRAVAIQLLYSFEQNHYRDDGDLLVDDALVDLSEAARAFADELFKGWQAQRTAIDAALDGRLDNWSLVRLAVVDRSILRLGCFELIYSPQVPPKVAINEYIELAKQFGSDAKTAKLVNGVLDRIAREHRAAEIAVRTGDG